MLQNRLLFFSITLAIILATRNPKMCINLCCALYIFKFRIKTSEVEKVSCGNGVMAVNLSDESA